MSVPVHNPSTDAPVVNTKITTLCLFQFCLGYRSAIRPSGSHVTDAHTDIISAAVVVLASFLMIFLMILLTFCLLHMLMMAFHRPATSSPSSSPYRIVSFFDSLNTHAPLAPGNTKHEGGCTCSICLDDLEDSKQAVIRRLPCSHAFHATCIDRWFLQSRFVVRAATDKPKCPVCNTLIFESKALQIKKTKSFTQNLIPDNQSSTTLLTGNATMANDDIHIPIINCTGNLPLPNDQFGQAAHEKSGTRTAGIPS